jgi:uncharacterized protein GlcG (DUF336 family)
MVREGTHVNEQGGSTVSQTFEKWSITAERAQIMVNAAAAKAQEIGVPMVIAVVDDSGILKAFLRMDGAKLLSVDIAQNKAWTAASFGIATDQWHEFIKNDAPLLTGIPSTPRLIVFGGGYPIVANGQVVGGIGCSGGHYSQDMECAQAGLAAWSQEA